MQDEEAKKLITDVFEMIKKSKTIDNIESIAGRLNIPSKNFIDIVKYPKINFSISADDVQTLIDNKVIKSDLNFSENITSTINDTLTRLLYSIAWKNGDLNKIKHIIQGIKDCNHDKDNKEDAVVFYQFGKFLTKLPGQPIVDQHVIRAFLVSQISDIADIHVARQLGSLNKKHKPIIEKYKQWLISDNLTDELKTQREYSYYIDKLLFASGKTIKKKGQ